MEYRCWTDPTDWTKLREEVLREVDEAVRFGEKYGIHVCLNFHRAPGYCVNPPPEPKSVGGHKLDQAMLELLQAF